ncbi:hypothetical protein O9929_04645 [Vibrio lentus]|nr:hypothetical protein [Vibrio lentus]
MTQEYHLVQQHHRVMFFFNAITCYWVMREALTRNLLAKSWRWSDIVLTDDLASAEKNGWW